MWHNVIITLIIQICMEDCSQTFAQSTFFTFLSNFIQIQKLWASYSP